MAIDYLPTVRKICSPHGTELYRGLPNEMHFVVREPASWRGLCEDLHAWHTRAPDAGEFYLVTVAANDERELEDGAFKLYCVFSHSHEDIFVWVEYILPGEEYPSIADLFPAFEPFQREMADLMGIFPEGVPRDRLCGSYLHRTAYPRGLFPLRRDQTLAQVCQQVEAYVPQPEPAEMPRDELAPGEMILTVGPVHAGVIPPGRFDFRIAGEAIRGLDMRLGYTHKGLERLFQSKYPLADGWKLAEFVEADSAFAHSLAYCRAVEAIVHSEVPAAAEYARALFVEMERITNHIADTAAIAHDVAFELFASDFAVLREKMLRLNAHATGHRLLRGLNRPGGICLSKPLPLDDLGQTIQEVGTQFLAGGQQLIENADFRQRAIDTGILSGDLARACGATGFVARATGRREHDFRLNHPYGLYREVRYQAQVAAGTRSENRRLPRALTGDVFSRVQLRLEEIHLSMQIIRQILDEAPGWSNGPFWAPIQELVRRAPNFTTGLGYVEGWRGDIVYWIMKDNFERIYRCKVRDPSVLNWPALARAIIPHTLPGISAPAKTLLGDFPLVNKSFNLSYSGNDL